MLVLGVSDLPSPAAAVVADGRLRAVVGQDDRPDATEGDDPFPWPLIDAALAAGGGRREDVGTLAVAGRFAVPWAVRRSRRLASLSALVPARQVQAAWQVALRATGFGAMTADLTAERLEARVRAQGFTRARVVMVDAHRALAEAGYRAQAEDDVLVVSLQPLGDGRALAVHHGVGGMVDRLVDQPGAPGLHAHLARVADALGVPVDDPDRLDGLASRGRVDPTLVAALTRDLRAEGAAFASDRAPRGAEAALVRALREVAPEDAAASVLANLGDVVASVVRRQARAHGVRRVVLVGALAELPRVVEAVAASAELDALFVPPRAGRDALALGAALGHAGVGPAALSWRLGPAPDPADVARAGGAGRRHGEARDVVRALAEGRPVVRWRERAGQGTAGLGERALLVRGDRADAIVRAREAAGLPAWVEPLTLPAGDALDLGVAAACGRVATAALRPAEAWARAHAGLLAPDGLVRPLIVDAHEAPALGDLVAQASEEGISALAVFPLRAPDGAPRTTVAQAAAIGREGGGLVDLGAVVLGAEARP